MTGPIEQKVIRYQSLTAVITMAQNLIVELFGSILQEYRQRCEDDPKLVEGMCSFGLHILCVDRLAYNFG